MKMSVTEAIRSRMSCRAFLPTAVPEAMVREILDEARRSPSGGNLQPWQVHVLTGAPLAGFRALIQARMPAHPMGEGAGYDIYPPNLTEPWRGRRFRNGEDLYAAIKVPREDKAARLAQFARNYDFFGAPVALFFSLDRQMGPPQWSDVGMFMLCIMLLARERGLHTCPQESWTVWHGAVAEFLHFPASRVLFCGMALGYRDESAPINTLRTERAPLGEIAEFLGF
ncbi:MAG: nitroreductase [Steroidobacteraceae bacterium]